MTNWLYRSGDLWLPEPIVKLLDSYLVGNDKTLFYLNFWHMNHFFSGVLFALLFPTYSFWFYLVVHTVWELWQLFIGMTKQNLRGLLDIINDTLIGSIGFYIVKRYA